MATEIKETNQNLIERLFSVGAHFGFGKSRRHPTVVPYLFGTKQGTDIFDLEKTSELLVDAKGAMENAGKKGDVVLFVGTKDEVARLVKATAEKVEMPYVTNRWIGGLLTNFAEIKKRTTRLHELTEQGESGELERKYTKKERVMIGRELGKLTHNFGGVRHMERLPQLLLIIDPRHDEIALREACELDIPVVGVTSSDGDISKIIYPVIANDALRGSVSFILDELVTAYQKGKEQYTEPEKSEAKSPQS